MSTQTSGFPSVPLGITQPFKNIRLLEVPDEVLDIIANGDEALYFKSAASPSDAEVTKEGNLHLCSNEKAWLIKQVSTSNSVYVTRTSSLEQHQNGHGSNWDDTMIENAEDVPNVSSLGITAISKPTNILELYPVPDGSHESVVHEYLRQLVPATSPTNDDSINSEYSLQEIYSHIPAPTFAIQRALAQNCVFELPWSISISPPSDPLGMKPSSTHSDSNAKAYIPTPALLLETWHKIVEAATISDTKITGDLEADVLLEAFSEPDDSWQDNSNNVFKAVAKRMFERDGYLVALGLITKAVDTHTKDGLSEMEVARWVGNMIMKVQGELEKASFEEKWENAVPAGWIKYCFAEVLGGACKLTKDEDGKEQVSWRPFTIENGTTTSAGEQTSNDKPAAAATTTSKGKRKWHEKFAAQRNAKKVA